MRIRHLLVPVISWCPVDGEGHTIPTFAAAAVATFLGQF
jgi:hypothetical protein